VLADGDHVATVKLATATHLDLAVHGDAAFEEQVPGVGSRVRDIRELEQLPQPDHVAADMDLLHGLILAFARELRVPKRVLLPGMWYTPRCGYRTLADVVELHSSLRLSQRV
jgi:hypothetical protein